MRKHKAKYLLWMLCSAILFSLFIFQTNNLKIISAKNVHSITQEEEDQSLSHEQIASLTDQFMDKLIQKTKNNKVLEYDTKEGLTHAFNQIATSSVVSTYIEYYYHEEQDGLYLKTTAKPPWFNKENDYDMVQLESNKVKVKQVNDSALYGTYTIVYEFTRNKSWKITDITHL
ncbi:MAG TPA: hypothetical protein VK105_12095 [Virgibacillus sp.]|nr:hypothetical protein [Virgibacillus sp.]HLR67847.1 hypothetical protein [Virgibacillus sp.]